MNNVNITTKYNNNDNNNVKIKNQYGLHVCTFNIKVVLFISI